MKRFIRTVENYIIDLQSVIERLNQFINKKITLNDIKLDYRVYGDSTYLVLIHKKTILPLTKSDIVKQADTIEELIEVGDLTNYGFVRRLGESKYDPIFYNGFEWIYLKLITELYTKQGRNYILVAEKIDGEWRVL